MELKGATVEVLQKGPEKLDKISMLISKFQVNWEILLKFCGLPKKPELYGEVWMREYDF